MARINIYVPDDLHKLVKTRGLNISHICQQALETALQESGTVPQQRRPWQRLTEADVNWIKEQREI